ncbi:membrane protein FAM174A isoform X1 [Dermochelys coriacea]|uniref:membrane protein FAM174A isoform X1 n=1 Tax=Dermochelys coriacea TaxID=27794 RepID=UPI001CA91AC7|nr:membrane protein FAM174A isoform X1 [Dermochelys coriacea]
MPPPLRELLAGLLLGALCVEAAAAISETRSALPQGGTPGEATRSSNGSSSSLAVSAPPERNQPMTQRALAVLVVASAALIVYFVIRTVRTEALCAILECKVEHFPLGSIKPQKKKQKNPKVWSFGHQHRKYGVGAIRTR